MRYTKKLAEQTKNIYNLRMENLKVTPGLREISDQDYAQQYIYLRGDQGCLLAVNMLQERGHQLEFDAHDREVILSKLAISILRSHCLSILARAKIVPYKTQNRIGKFFRHLLRR
jgi:hypothetical protein